MSEIKVNTDDLRNNAAAFNAEAQNLNATLAELLSVLNALDLGKYQSQLSDRVSLRVSPTQDRISIYQQDLQDLAEKLYNKADEFEQANTDSMSNVSNLSTQMYDFTNSSGTMTASAILHKMYTKKSNGIWSWGGGIFGNLRDWFICLFSKEVGENKPNIEDLQINLRLNFREDPGINSTIIRTLVPGERVVIENIEVTKSDSDEHDWIMVKTSEGLKGYIALDVVSKNSNNQKETLPDTHVPEISELELEDTYTKQIHIDRNADVSDCREFVVGQGRYVPGYCNNEKGGFYTGFYKNKKGEKFPDGNYCYQEPKPGAIMFESPSEDNDIDYGHVSYVYSVTYDKSGKVISFKIGEGNWAKDKDGNKIYKDETFYWNEISNTYQTENGNRQPDGFYY